MNKNKAVKEKFEIKDIMQLRMGECGEYKQKFSKPPIAELIGIFILTAISLFIMMGLLLNFLPSDKYFYVPLGVCPVVLVMDANGLVNEIKNKVVHFINYLNDKHVTKPVGTSQTTVPNPLIKILSHKLGLLKMSYL
ncbi:MAG: hypothetical protein JW776_13325 [Candidatus Lokiarchaeota archaeon]|nr:hypothetical protein [Candidatus Lokiarchaeota archaeon]